MPKIKKKTKSSNVLKFSFTKTLKMLKKLSVKEIKTSTKIYSSQASVLGLL